MHLHLDSARVADVNGHIGAASFGVLLCFASLQLGLHAMGCHDES